VTKPTIQEAQAFVKGKIEMMCAMIPSGYRVRNIRCVRSIKPKKAEDQDSRIFTDIDIDENADGGPSIYVRISMSGLGTKGQDWRIQILTRIGHELFHAQTSRAEKAAKASGGGLSDKIIDDLLEECGNVLEATVAYCLIHDVRIGGA